ncbi:hypothetical protein LO82_22330 [Vibrio vulnificus]|uniref:hypothetical protein n=1 Tax=Vibrio vulnificus TaxID=672 RepID=UPI0006AD551F|nr:hypothetical protein [Vibrio vulnificus]KOR93668.1 hypothetical protein LO82_22330 [Vibrio vulnificus]HDY8067607.1 hypothetical protein [Vibrio vulnificus]
MITQNSRDKFNKLLKQKAILKQCVWAGLGETTDSNDCEGKIIKAHSIQKSKFLKKISDNGHVKILSVDLEKNELLGSFDQEGIKKFSTFTGFCGKHDKAIFQPIEDKPFKATKEQLHLYAYRAASQEYHNQFKMLKKYDDLLTLAKEIDDRDLINQVGLKFSQYGASSIEYMELCEHLKNNFIKKEYTMIKHHYHKLNKEYPIVCCASFIPYKNHIGSPVISDADKLNLLVLPSELKNSFCMMLNVFPENGATHIIISHLKSRRKDYDFINKVFKMKGHNKEVAISNLMLNYCENMAFSPTYINDKFNDLEKSEICDSFVDSIKNTDNFKRVTLNLFR